MPELEKGLKKEKGKWSLKLAAKWSPLIKVGATLLSLSLTFSLGALVEKNYNLTRSVSSLPFMPAPISLPAFPIRPDVPITAFPRVVLQAERLEAPPAAEVQPINVVVWTEGDEVKLGLYVDGIITQETLVPMPIEEPVPEPVLELPKIDIVVSDEPKTTGWRNDPRRPGSTHS